MRFLANLDSDLERLRKRLSNEGHGFSRATPILGLLRGFKPLLENDRLQNQSRGEG